MSLVLKDRVLETAAAPGTGAVTLLGAVTGYQTFSAAVGNGNTCYYTIADQSGANWEVGLGTYASAGNTLTRTTILSSSNAGSTVNFASGTQNVFVTYPSEKAVYLDASGNVQPSLGTATFSSITDSGLTSGRVTYAGTSGLLQDSANLTFNGTTLTANTLNLTNALGVASGGTGLTSLTSGYIPYGNGTSAFSSSSNLYYDSANIRLGVGISTPATTLCVNATATIRDPLNSVAQLTFGGSGSDYYGRIFYNLSTNAMQFFVNSSEVARFSSSGYLGIGTSSPSSLLSISGSNASPIGISITNTNSGTVCNLSAMGATGFGVTNWANSTVLESVPTSTGGLVLSSYTGNMYFQTNNRQPYMTLDSSGNLGLGVTPSAWTTFKVMQLGTTMAVAGVNGTSSNVFANAYYDGSYKYIGTGAAYRYEQNIATGYHAWHIAPSGTAGNAISFTQAMTLNNSGQLGIGTTSPSYTLDVQSGSYAQIRLKTSSSYDAILGQDGSSNFNISNGGSVQMTLTASGNLGLGVTPSAWSGKAFETPAGGILGYSTSSMNMTQNAYFNGTNWIYKNTAAATYYGQGASGAGQHAWYTAPSGTAGNAITFTQAMTLTNSGTLFVGQTSAVVNENGMGVSSSQTSGGSGVLNVTNTASSSADNSPPVVICKAMTTTSSSARFVQFYANTTATPMGGIVGNGASNVQFASISDAREKTNIAPINGSLNKILALKPSSFDWIKDGSHVNAGFIAQDVQTVFPEFVVENMANEGEEQRYGLTGGMNGGIIAHLVSAIQELKAEFDAYKATHP